MLPTLNELLNEPLEQFDTLPCSVDDLDAMHILVDEEYTPFIYHPMILQKEHPRAPFWCVAFIDLLKYVFQFKEWVHTMDKQTNVDFEQDDPLNFLVYTDTLLDIPGPLRTKLTQWKSQNMTLNKAVMIPLSSF